MFVILQKIPDTHYYPILLSIAEIFGLISIILVGLLFPKNGFDGTYNWTTNPFSYHPLMMTIGLLFCYGNAVILYRTFKQTSKYTVKLLHALLLIVSFIFAAIGLAAIIRNKNLRNASHFLTFHSWFGLTTIILFVFQWICGFISFLVPKLSLNSRKAYMPSHRLWGKIIFLSSVIAVLTGLSEYGATKAFFIANDEQRSRRLIIDFFGVFTCLFSLIVIYLLSNPDYQRPVEITVDKTEHIMK